MNRIKIQRLRLVQKMKIRRLRLVHYWWVTIGSVAAGSIYPFLTQGSWINSSIGILIGLVGLEFFIRILERRKQGRKMTGGESEGK